MAVRTLCPRCGELYGDQTATCRYCGYLGIIPITVEENEEILKVLKGEKGEPFTDRLVKEFEFINKLRDKYQLKQSSVYDEALWNNRQKKDENELKQEIQEQKERTERWSKETEQQSKLSWKDRNKAIGVTCPTCGSSDRVYRISAAKKGFLAGLMGAASAGLQAKTFQCKNCGYKW